MTIEGIEEGECVALNLLRACMSDAGQLPSRRHITYLLLTVSVAALRFSE
jgi:hypothetical protein